VGTGEVVRDTVTSNSE